jgi:hypothetical protein
MVEGGGSEDLGAEIATGALPAACFWFSDYITY